MARLSHGATGATRRAWVASELYHPEETSTGHVMTCVAEHLVRRGWTVGAVTVQPTYSRRGERAPRRETHAGVHIARAWSTTFDKNRLAGRLLNGVTTSLSMTALAFARVRRGDVVLAVTNPPLLPFLLLAVCRARGARCVLLVHDVHPEQMVAVGMLREGAALARLVRAATGWLYRRLDHVIVIGRDMAAVVEAKRGRADVPVTVIPNWADEHLVTPGRKEDSDLLRRLGWSDAFVVQYAGNMGRPNAIELVVEAATLLRDHPRLRFLFVGTGAKLPWLRREVEARGLRTVAIEPPVPRAQQAALLGACDVSVVPLVPGMYGLGVPSRTYNVLAAARPLVAVAHPDSELARLVGEERVGWVVPDGARAEELAAVLRAAAEAPAAELEACRARARAAAEGPYAHLRVLDRFHDVLAAASASEA